MKKTKIFIYVLILFVFVFTFTVLFNNKSGEIVELNMINEYNQKEEIQNNFEEDLNYTIDNIKNKYLLEQENVKLDNNLTEEEKQEKLNEIIIKMNQELFEKINEESLSVDKKIIKTNKTEDLDLKYDTFIMDSVVENISNISDDFFLDEKLANEYLKNKDKIIDYIEIERYYLNNKQEYNKLLKKELLQITPTQNLPGTYFEVNID